MHRSGSTWSFNVCVRLLRLTHPRARLRAEFTGTPGELIESLQPRCDHLVIKAHTLDRPAMALSRSGAAKVVYTHRDPYDSVASLMRMFQFSFEEAVAAIQNSLRLLQFHRDHGLALIVPYESLMDRPLETIGEIGRYLGIRVAAAAIERVHAETSFAAVKAIAEKIGDRECRFVVRRGGDVYDTRTHLHRHHVRDGSTGYGRRMLSREQCRSVRAMLREFARSTNRGTSRDNAPLSRG